MFSRVPKCARGYSPCDILSAFNPLHSTLPFNGANPKFCSAAYMTFARRADSRTSSSLKSMQGLYTCLGPFQDGPSRTLWAGRSRSWPLGCKNQHTCVVSCRREVQAGSCTPSGASVASSYHINVLCKAEFRFCTERPGSHILHTDAWSSVLQLACRSLCINPGC